MVQTFGGGCFIKTVTTYWSYRDYVAPVSIARVVRLCGKVKWSDIYSILPLINACSIISLQ